MSPKKRKNKKENITTATIWLIAHKGMQAAIIRAIAQRAQITEGAVYRHFPSKMELLQETYEHLVSSMAETKKHLAASEQPFSKKLRQWVRIMYEFYDEYPEACTFVLLTPHNLERELFHRQGKVFMRMFRTAQRTGEAKPMRAPLALSHFSGVMLNVLRLINEGTLGGPAIQYLDDVTMAIRQMLVEEE